MPQKKLTPRLREKIKSDFRNLRQADFEGEALAYLKKVRGAHKGRVSQRKKREAQSEKAKKAIPVDAGPGKGKSIKVGGETYFEGGRVYEIVALSARNKSQTIKQFVKENEDQLEKLLRDYLVFAKKEIDDLRKLIKELPKDSKIFSPIRTRSISKSQAHFILHLLKKTLIEICNIYPVVFIEYAFDLEANLHFNCPRPGEYKDFEDCGELSEYLEDRYSNITWINHEQPS